MDEVTTASFKEAFPVFQGQPAASIDFWIGLGIRLMSVERWGDLFSYGLMLFVAHNLALETNSAVGANGTIGAVSGILSSASIDKVSYSRDASAAMDDKAGHWNLTTYGLRYLRLVKLVGAGPVQVGVPPGMSNYNGGTGWPGVIYPIGTP